MVPKCLKSLLVAAFSLFFISFASSLKAQENNSKKQPPKLNPAKIIIEHISDAHEFHFFTLGDHPVSIPLPVILYSPAKGWSAFMSSNFAHGAKIYDGYILLEEKFIEEHKLEEVKDAGGKPIFKLGRIYATDNNGMPDATVKVYDFSMGRNVVQTFISVLLLIWIMMVIAKLYKQGQGTTSAPTGFQNAIEPVIIFIRDDVGKPNLGSKYERYMPFLLTVFFFILINNLIGLVPGAANVSGNIAFTGFLGIIAFFVILFSTNKHFWSHIFNPPVPLGVKPIMIPVEILGIFTKPFALIIRLFANMISGHIIILSFICLIFIFGAMNTALGWGTSPFFILLAVFIYLIEILVAFIQAYIFASLTAVFIGMSMEGGHDHNEHAHDDKVLI
ncbi:MAG: F0F1 ATP synthase subunit A [Bacteroidetes bacterium]|nr:F0F1 ATP synthase subunit A [Bacteroidota bacterium]MBS1972827.1 F0F1 ATP synthase subunit A [Bacteroidota bacterium]